MNDARDRRESDDNERDRERETERVRESEATSEGVTTILLRMYTCVMLVGNLQYPHQQLTIQLRVVVTTEKLVRAAPHGW